MEDNRNSMIKIDAMIPLLVEHIVSLLFNKVILIRRKKIPESNLLIRGFPVFLVSTGPLFHGSTISHISGRFSDFRFTHFSCLPRYTPVALV